MKLKALLVIFPICSWLVGCGDSGVSEVQEWMNQVRKETQSRVKPIQEPKVFVPVSYESTGALDPFDSGKLMAVLARLKAENNNGLKPDFDRPREALEAFPLESMRMVGTISNKKSLQGLVQVGKAVYPTSVGSYVGQNFGRVISISETRIDLVETVQDATGDWVERKASLELQEAKK